MYVKSSVTFQGMNSFVKTCKVYTAIYPKKKWGKRKALLRVVLGVFLRGNGPFDNLSRHLSNYPTLKPKNALKYSAQVYCHLGNGVTFRKSIWVSGELHTSRMCATAVTSPLRQCPKKVFKKYLFQKNLSCQDEILQVKTGNLYFWLLIHIRY